MRDARWPKKKKRKMQRVVFAIKDGWKQGWKRYSRHWEISIVKKVVSLFFYSPSPKVIRISLSLEIDPRNIFSFQISLRIERLRDRFRFSKAFVDWTIGEIALLKRIYEKGRMIERNSILSQWKAALLLCSEAVKHGLVRGSWKRAETMIESWSVSFQWGTMCNWEGQGALL